MNGDLAQEIWSVCIVVGAHRFKAYKKARIETRVDLGEKVTVK